MKKLLAITVLGNNRSSEFITENKFNIKKYLKKYRTHFTSQVIEREKDHSCLFYETMDAVHATKIDPAMVDFVFARGCVGRGTEDQLTNIINNIKPDKDTTVIVVAKSFGVIDFLRYLKKNDIKVDAGIFIDGYASLVSRRSVSKRYKVGNKKKRRLVIPNQIKKLYNITQSNEGFKGLQAGASHDSRITNVSLRPGDVEWPLFYNRYAGSQAISLEMKHSHMDELAMTLKLYDGVNFKSLIKGVVS